MAMRALLLLLLLLVAPSAMADRPWLLPFGRKQLDSESSAPEQVHISLAGPKHMRVTWTAASDSSAANTVQYGIASKQYTASSTGDSTSYSYMLYKSGTLRNAVLGPLEDNTTYYYRIGASEPEFSFKTPPPSGSNVPVTFAVAGDLGQTRWTKSTLEHIQQCDYDVLLCPGDLSYADYYQPLWDSFGKLVEPLASSRPWMVTEGNHEIEKIPFVGKPFKAYNARWPMPYKESGSTSNLYYSFEVAGVHVLMLGSYTPTDENSDQYKWLQEDLKKVDRSKTPWLIALIHAPWYNTNVAHQGEGDDMMESMEPLLRQAKVDIVFAGHVHAYERTVRVYKRSVDPCGMLHITIGDGGNREGLARRFKDPQPEWSAFRQASFGHGELKILNSTHAFWSWHRNDDDEAVIGDQLFIRSLSSATSDCASSSE